MSGEGIVQPLSKDRDQLSRRLHQLRPRHFAGAFYFAKEARMPACRTVAHLSPTDTAYIAGLIDGEGTITLSRKHRNENRQLSVSISNTEIGLLEYVLETVGAGKITRKRTSQAHHTPSFTYAISNRQALSLLEQIHPYLKTYKSDRSALVLQKYIALTPRNGKYSEEQSKNRLAFKEAVLGIKAARNWRFGFDSRHRP